MKTNNEEKHTNNDGASKDRTDSSNNDNQERRTHSDQDSNRERKIFSSSREQSSSESQDEQNRKRRPRVRLGDKAYTADPRNRHTGPSRHPSSDSDRYPTTDRYSSDRSNQQSEYPPRDRYSSDRNSNQQSGYAPRDRYSSDRGGNQQSGYAPRDRYSSDRRSPQQGGGYPERRGFNQGGGGPKKVIKPLKKKKPFLQIKYKESADPSAPIRLNKYIANAGVCSRREADEFIQSGAVKVNGTVITELGTKITRADTVLFNDKPIALESKIYVLLNKPKGFVTTTDDPENRKTVMDLVKSACSERIYPVGRLDRGTTGVLLLTNDGDLASKLTHPRYEKRKIYQVWVDKPVTADHMQEIADGIELEDGEIHVDAISYVTEDDLTQIGIEIHSGKNRIVRRIFEKFDYRVLKLDRVYFAGLTKKNLSRGRWRYLTEKEVNMLRMGAFD